MWRRCGIEAEAAAAVEAVAVVGVAVVVAVNLTALLGGRLTVNWHWRLIGLL